MLSRLKRLLWSEDNPIRTLEQGEQVMLEGIAARRGGLFGAGWGPLILTNRRLIWYESVSNWPLKPLSAQWRLSDIASVGEKGNLFAFASGRRRLKLRLRNGKSVSFLEGQGRLDEWITAIRRVVGEDDKGVSLHPNPT